MYEWLSSELQQIATPKFHQVEGPAADDFREAVLNSPIKLSDAYKAFVLEFGNARFFRNGLFSHDILVFAGPRAIPGNPGCFCVGFLNGAAGCMRDGEPAIYNSGMKKLISPSFDRWFKKGYTSARAKYPKKEWQAILSGPRPFDAKEASMLAARAKFLWSDRGADANRDRLIEIENASERSIPRFTLGVRSLDRRLNGALHLDVSSISPGTKAVLTHSCYKEFYPPNQTELFELPPPGPEDRKYYAEFK